MIRKSKMIYVPYILALCWNVTRSNSELEELLELSPSDLSRILHELRYNEYLINSIEEDGRRKPNQTNKDKIFNDLIEDIQLKDNEINSLKEVTENNIIEPDLILSVLDPKSKIIANSKQFSHYLVLLILNLSDKAFIDKIYEIEKELTENEASEEELTNFNNFLIKFQIKLIFMKSLNPTLADDVFNRLKKISGTKYDKNIYDLSLKISTCFYYYLMLPEFGSPLDLYL